MSTDVTIQDADKPTTEESQPTTTATNERKRPRLDLGAGERRRGKTMFGLVLGTLNKAKIEDKERNASEAAKKRHLIEQRLQNKLKKETDSVRRAEEAKKDKTGATRKEEDLQLKDSIYKYRRTRLPLLAHFLITSDNIPADDEAPTPEFTITSALPRRSHPPPLYYLPAILTPAQESFLSRRKAEVAEAADKEWTSFRVERETGVTEVESLRQKVANFEAKRKAEKTEEDAEMETDQRPRSPSRDEESSKPAAGMDVDEPASNSGSASKDESREEPAPMQADGDDAVEY